MASGAFAYVGGWKREFESKGWWHSFELPDGRSIEGVCSVEGLRTRIIDCWDNPRFHQIHAALKSRVEYRQMDVYDLTPTSVGRFDFVPFMGVLYHLKHPLLALERVCAITNELAVVDSFILREEHRPGENVENRPVMESYENEELGGQTDNWLPNGACIACYRKWESAPKRASITAPKLLEAVHHTNFGINFETRYDEYVLASFCMQGELSIDRVQPQVGEFGVRPVHLSRSESGVWQTNFKLPPGLTPGWHDVSLRIDDSNSNLKRLAVDMPVPRSAIRIEGLSDGTSWEPGILDLRKGNVLTAWVSGLPENADRANIRAALSGEKLTVSYVSPPAEPGEFKTDARQVNIQVPYEVPGGSLELEILIGASETPPMMVEIAR